MQLAPMISRYWPFANGSGRVLDKFARDIDLGSGPRSAFTSDGFDLTVLADDLIGRHILMSGKFDRSVVQVLLDLAEPGDVLLDIGANIGYVSACFLANVPDSQVICVEPQPGIVDLLRGNLDPSRAQIHEVGLSDQDGTLRFAINPHNRGGSRISPNGDHSIPVRNASSFLSELPRVDLIKIDVEGHEEPIFRSIASELKRLRPRAILFEDQNGGAISRLLDGYQTFGIRKRLFRTELVPLPADCNDYVAVAKSR
jgi:FkbM family methyltransferase